MLKAHVLPFVLYLFGTMIASRFASADYPLAYACVVVLVGGVTIWALHGTKSLKPHWRILPGIVVGLVGIALWIGLSALHLEAAVAKYLPQAMQPEARVGFNPFETLGSGLAIWSFIAIRTIGIAVLVPVAEELFWRSFLLRWLIDPDWEKVPLGEYTLSSCLTVTLLFTVAHPEWFAAALYCLLLNGLLYWKRDLWQCIVAHAVSNLTLTVYVISAQAWWLW